MLATTSVSWSSDLVGLAHGLELEGVNHYVTSVLPLLLSSHNWNTLFMGPNAVADAIAQKYNATKSQVFDHVSEGALPVIYIGSVLPRGRCLDLDSRRVSCLRPTLKWEQLVARSARVPVDTAHSSPSLVTGSALSLDTEHTTTDEVVSNHVSEKQAGFVFMVFKVRLSKVLLLEHVPSIKQPEPFSCLPLVRVCIVDMGRN